MYLVCGREGWSGLVFLHLNKVVYVHRGRSTCVLFSRSEVMLFIIRKVKSTLLQISNNLTLTSWVIIIGYTFVPMLLFVSLLSSLVNVSSFVSLSLT